MNIQINLISWLVHRLILGECCGEYRLLQGHAVQSSIDWLAISLKLLFQKLKKFSWQWLLLLMVLWDAKTEVSRRNYKWLQDSISQKLSLTGQYPPADEMKVFRSLCMFCIKTFMFLYHIISISLYQKWERICCCVMHIHTILIYLSELQMQRV